MQLALMLVLELVLAHCWRTVGSSECAVAMSCGVDRPAPSEPGAWDPCLPPSVPAQAGLARQDSAMQELVRLRSQLVPSGGRPVS